MIPFNLAAGSDSAPIPVPSDTPIFIIANDTTTGNRGTGFISLEQGRSVSGLPFLEWSGIDSTHGGSPILDSNIGFATGVTMLDFSFDAQVMLAIGPGATSFVVHNGDQTVQAGVVWMLTAP